MGVSIKKNIKQELPYVAILSMVLAIMGVFNFNKQFVASSSDLPVHVKLIQHFVSTGDWPLYTLYYRAVYWVSFFRADSSSLQFATVLVLTICLLMKGILTFYLVLKNNINRLLAFGLTFALIVCSPIMNWWNPFHIYLGQITSNVWHNSTTIFAFPTAIGLFYYSLRFFEEFRNKEFFWLVVLIVLNGFSKPNYLLAFIPVFVLFFGHRIIIDNKIDKCKKTGYITLILAPVVLMLLEQYLSTYYKVGSGAGVIISPLLVWKLYSPNIVASIVLSLAFPIIFELIYSKNVLKNKKLLFAWAVFIAALVQFVLFAESGPRCSNGNFYWGSVFSLYILFMVSITELMKQKKDAKYYFAPDCRQIIKKAQKSEKQKGFLGFFVEYNSIKKKGVLLCSQKIKRMKEFR